MNVRLFSSFRIWQILWSAVLCLHGIKTVDYWHQLPQGFPVGHLKFWSNQFLPPAVLILCVAALLAVWLKPLARGRSILVAAPVVWATFSIVGRLLFPISLRWLWLVSLAVALMLAMLVYWPRQTRKMSPVLMVLFGFAGIAFGFVLAFGQRAPLPGTRPLNVILNIADLPQQVTTSQPSIRINDNLEVATGVGNFLFDCGMMEISASPLLTFYSHSPDRCWSNLASEKERWGPDRVLTGLNAWEDGADLSFRDDGMALLRLRPDKGADALDVEAITRLETAVYTHLNGFAEFYLKGFDQLSVSFSACPDDRIVFVPFEYPGGKPLRFGYLNADARFHVVEATRAEKGPYHALAVGELRRDEALTITLFDNGQPVCRIVMYDWAAQADTQLSPTAGWGVPSNSISFGLSTPDNTGAFIRITLSGTGVGCGYNTVGHAAGTYRNRMRIEDLSGFSSSSPANGS